MTDIKITQISDGIEITTTETPVRKIKATDLQLTPGQIAALIKSKQPKSRAMS